MTDDIRSPKGRESRVQEREAVGIFNCHFPDTHYKFIHDRDSRSPFNGELFNKHGKLVGIVKTKCRQDSFETFRTTYKWEWLLTAESIENAAKIADARCVPLWGFLYIVPEKFLLVKMLYCDGQWKTRTAIRETRTQATTNGGTAIRVNRFFDIRSADRFTDDVEGLNIAKLGDDPKGLIA